MAIFKLQAINVALICLLLSYPKSMLADVTQPRDILGAQNCRMVLKQETRSCRVIFHGLCDGGRSVATYFQNGEQQYTRIMVDGVNMIASRSGPTGLIFNRQSEGDDPVDRSIIENGGIDTFSFRSVDDADQGIVITMSGTVRKLEKTRRVSGQNISYLFWDWTYQVNGPNQSYVSKVETTSELHDALDIWLANYVESRDQYGRMEITDDQATALIHPNEVSFSSKDMVCMHGV